MGHCPELSKQRSLKVILKLWHGINSHSQTANRSILLSALLPDSVPPQGSKGTSVDPVEPARLGAAAKFDQYHVTTHKGNNIRFFPSQKTISSVFIFESESHSYQPSEIYRQFSLDFRNIFHITITTSRFIPVQCKHDSAIVFDSPN